LDFLDEDDAQQIAQGIWTVYVMLESDLRHSGWAKGVLDGERGELAARGRLKIRWGVAIRTLP
jgi:hypothetical protein